jgi:8-oxo-dGTP pyrophosphatase MutT (NUDIX family)
MQQIGQRTARGSAGDDGGLRRGGRLLASDRRQGARAGGAPHGLRRRHHPKGKVDPGESLPRTAVREIAEETGLEVALGVPLGVSRYPLPSGREKIVHYWSAEVSERAVQRSTFKPNAEIAALEWVTIRRARGYLSYSPTSRSSTRSRSSSTRASRAPSAPARAGTARRSAAAAGRAPMPRGRSSSAGCSRRRARRHPHRVGAEADRVRPRRALRHDGRPLARPPASREARRRHQPGRVGGRATTRCAA